MQPLGKLHSVAERQRELSGSWECINFVVFAGGCYTHEQYHTRQNYLILQPYQHALPCRKQVYSLSGARSFSTFCTGSCISLMILLNSAPQIHSQIAHSASRQRCDTCRDAAPAGASIIYPYIKYIMRSHFLPE